MNARMPVQHAETKFVHSSTLRRPDHACWKASMASASTCRQEIQSKQILSIFASEFKVPDDQITLTRQFRMLSTKKIRLFSATKAQKTTLNLTS